ncbi:hypothetical protein NQ317_017798 [Molorchus minor]|uniref:RING-type domain-containing protein n=1 Tax=Molorchus minor TaxID=1323400 RepID=A0ABQ9K219_9CUCU|nr:hypothetical protein NQ317_017798 [Molorchus minor]
MDDVNYWLKYPLILKYKQGDLVTYEGIVHVNDEDYKVSIIKYIDGKYKVALPPNLLPYQREIQCEISILDNPHIITVLDCLVRILSQGANSKPVNVNMCDTHKHILQEYSEFTAFYVNLQSSHISSDLCLIDTHMVDDKNRDHFVQISASETDSRGIFRIVKFDLPQPKEEFIVSSSLKAIYSQFTGTVEALQPFFDLMDILDKSCWILEPLQPERKHTHRRIGLGDNISVIIKIDPYNIANVPDMKFLGPERLIEQYRTIVNENLEKWMEEDDDVFSEILKLLGMVQFPLKPTFTAITANLLKESGECSICFSYNYNDKLPEIVCKSKFCENYYHKECLYEWLVSVNSVRFFNEVVGNCPNCDKSISCPIPRETN